MGRRAGLSGVRAGGAHRILFDFEFEGVRYRPTLERTPTEANLRRACKQLADIKNRIVRGTFNFREEFPDYRLKRGLPKPEDERQEQTCNQIFDKFLAHCETRVSMDDMAFSTLEGYRELLDRVFRPEIGEKSFEKVTYSQLAEILASSTKSRKKKTYNNFASGVRTAFKFGYKDRPGQFNPALALPTFRITRKDRPKIDPFTIQEAESIVEASHRTFGEAYGNYEEFRFFTGLRQSEHFALEVSDWDPSKGSIKVTKAVVLTKNKNRTKTNQDREIALCPRAVQVLQRQLALRQRMVAEGWIRHERLFFAENGKPFRVTHLPYNHWRKILKSLPIRYRKPYNSRHSFISWRLMIGHNRLLVAKEDGHSVTTMESTYAAWIEGAKPEDIELIKKAMGIATATNSDSSNVPDKPHEPPKAGSTLAVGGQFPTVTVMTTLSYSFDYGRVSVCSDSIKSQESATK